MRSWTPATHRDPCPKESFTQQNQDKKDHPSTVKSESHFVEKLLIKKKDRKGPILQGL
jgi:hypothetical protein